MKELSFEKSKEFLTPLAQYSKELSADYCKENGMMCGGDIEILYCFTRWLKPKRIVECGNGGSTKIIHDAVLRNKTNTIHDSIDPVNKRIKLDNVTIHLKRTEDVDLALFRSLTDGDFLFIDSSHEAPEQEYFAQHIFPYLAKGVYVHHHDWRNKNYENTEFLDWGPGHGWHGQWINGSGEMQVFLQYVRSHDNIEMLHCNHTALFDAKLSSFMEERFLSFPQGGSLYSKVML